MLSGCKTVTIDKISVCDCVHAATDHACIFVLVRTYIMVCNLVPVSHTMCACCNHVPVYVCDNCDCVHAAAMYCLYVCQYGMHVCMLQSCSTGTYVSMVCVHAGCCNHVLARMCACCNHVLVHIIARYLDGQGKIIMHAMQCSGNIFMRF